MYRKINRLKTLIFLVFSLSFLISSANAQQISCGTDVSKEYLQMMIARKKALAQARTSEVNQSKLPALKTLSITAWIVKDSLRNPGLTAFEINQAIALVNLDFKPMNLQFKVCDVKYIENFQYDSLVAKPGPGIGTNELSQMYIKYKDENRINMYFVKYLISDKGGVAYGLAPKPSIGSKAEDWVIITKPAVGDNKTIAHELGHFFGLPHTFETENGVEVVKRINCSTTGDNFCDTDADPQGDADGLTCQLKNGSKDSNGDFYTPPISNIMSYYPPSCKCTPGFTPDQYKWMMDMYLNNRKYLY